MLEEKGEKKIDIRNKMIDDLVVFTNKLQGVNHEVILMINANEPFNSGKGEVAKLISISDLR